MQKVRVQAERRCEGAWRLDTRPGMKRKGAEMENVQRKLNFSFILEIFMPCEFINKVFSLLLENHYEAFVTCQKILLLWPTLGTRPLSSIFFVFLMSL